MPRERAVAMKLHRGIERGLAAHGWQKRVRFLAFDDGFDHFGRDWLDISAVGKFRVGHDCRRIRIDQHDLITFFAQRFARLHTRIIKFAALPDHDWTGADKEDFFELIVPRHLRSAQNKTKSTELHARIANSLTSSSCQAARTRMNTHPRVV